MLYYVLSLSIDLAAAVGEGSQVPAWQEYAANIRKAAQSRLWDEGIGLFKDNETSSLGPQDGNSLAVVSGLASAHQQSRISQSLAQRWGPYGAPAPEAVIDNKTTISPFPGGFELQAHFLSGNARRGLDLIRLQWGFMLKDHRMTESTFIEGYSSDGSLVYPPYTEQARISHAHAWSTGPTSVLTFYVAGIRILEPLGKSWSIEPMLGDLKTVHAGLETGPGIFEVQVAIESREMFVEIQTPRHTTGSVSLPPLGCKGRVSIRDKSSERKGKDYKIDARTKDERFVIRDVAGGEYSVMMTCL